MRLILKIKLLPDDSQFKSLKKTLIEANTVCNYISEVAFSKKIFNQYKIHKETYYIIKKNFNLSAQMIVRCISKVSDSYKTDKNKQRKYKQTGAIAYDSRILTYKTNKVSIWTVDGRLKDIDFVCHNKSYIPYIKGEADLIFKNNKFYLFQSVEIKEEDVKNIEEFIGVDFGQKDIAVTSNNIKFNSNEITKIRNHYSKVRASAQSKGTKGAKKLLKRLSGREKRFVSINNHTISKQIVKIAKEQNKGIALEDLTYIRNAARHKIKAKNMKIHSWSFHQLRKFIEYKSKLSGVKVVVVRPEYTSQTCSCCMRIGKRNGKNFACGNCNIVLDADYNAAKNISAIGVVVNQPEKSNILSCKLQSV